MVETITYTIKGSLDQVVSIYADLNKFADHHPLIQKVDVLDSKPSEQLYAIYEQPFSWLPFKINYRARVIQKDERTFDYEITEIPFTKAYFKYVFTEEANQTIQIKLRIEILSKIIHKRILMNMMINAQDKIIASIQRA